MQDIETLLVDASIEAKEVIKALSDLYRNSGREGDYEPLMREQNFLHDLEKILKSISSINQKLNKYRRKI